MFLGDHTQWLNLQMPLALSGQSFSFTRSLHKSEILPDIVEVIMHSWRDSTQKQYKVYINKWLQFCSEGSHDPLHPTVRAVLSFLQEWLKLLGAEYSSFCSIQY